MASSTPSGIGRPLDPAYPSNVFILIAAPLAGLAWFVWKLATEGDWAAAIARAVVAGMAAFLAWAVARELDPDRPWTAGVAAVLSPAVIGAGTPSLWVGAAVLMAARITARTTGLSLKPTDLIPMAILSGLAASSDPGLVAGVVLGLTLMADRWLPDGALPLSVPVGLAGVAAAVGAAAVWGQLGPSPGAPAGPEWAIVAVAAVGIASLGRPRTVDCLCDFTAVPVTAPRVRLARLAAAAAAGLTFVWLGGVGLTAGSVVWSALAAVALPSIRR